ncbi:hypothetical protein GWK47_055184 [Chionoecetes opilio]|uniref:Uncharacterized protein n=1 Tax=Chionoecetes opilio TaxID=41210 RepID=A0A8J4Y6B9_CHIOP|nr:hypothetical protein GWK47_055184 [Chionoecetes opilio]
MRLLPGAPMERVFLAVGSCFSLPPPPIQVIWLAFDAFQGISSPSHPPHLGRESHRIAVVDNGGFVASELQTTQDPSVGSLRSKIDLFSLEDAIDALRQGSHAIILMYNYITLEFEYYMENDEWYAMKQDVLGTQVVWYFPKQTPWKYKFDEINLQLSWFGLIQHWKQVEINAYKKSIKRSNKGRGLREESRSPQALTLAHLEGVFYMVGFAWTISGFILLLEILKHRYGGRFAGRRY